VRIVPMMGAVLTVLTLVAPASAPAADRSLGQLEFESKCASCHGADAKGGGWMTKYLSHRPPALTQLAKNNGGVFPTDYAYRVIEGKKEVELHGPRDMPVWGAVIPAQVERQNLGQCVSDEDTVRRRIHAMIDYLSQLQE
jgi:mono/diheme cytochrome c family protein